MKILRKNCFLLMSILTVVYFFVITTFIGYLNIYNFIWIFIGIASFITHKQKERIQRLYITLPKLIRKTIVIFISLFMISFFVTETLIINHSRNKNIENAHCFILLGAGLNGSVPSVNLLQRIHVAIEHLKKDTRTKIIVSGGKGKRETVTEAEVMAKILQDNGIGRERIILEGQSTNTYENLLFSKKFIDSNKKIVIISSEFHLFRAKCIAKKLGYKDIGRIGSKSTALLLPNYYVREYFAIIKELFAGNI